MRLLGNVYLVGCGSWCGGLRLSRGGSCNVYLVDGGTELALIDAGDLDGIEDMLKNIRSLGFDPANIRKIFLTHAHYDHTLGLEMLLKHVKATVYGHSIARETLGGHSITHETLGQGPGIYQPGLHITIIPAPVHEIVKQGDSVKVGSVTMNVVELPGHTPDGLGFTIQLSEGTGCFTGDTAIGDQPMPDNSVVPGCIGWIDAAWRSNLLHHMASLKLLQAMNLAAFFPGHGISQRTPEQVKLSLEHCVGRLDSLLAIPNLGTMMRVAL